MDKKKTYFALNRSQWRAWLSNNFKTEQEIWLIFPAKSSNEMSVSYNDAVEEALCFGWIDGVAAKLDATHSLRRFTPRRKGSKFSRVNIERLICLEKKGMLHSSVRDEILQIINEPFIYPNDILDEIRKDDTAWINYNNLDEQYKRIRISYIEAARSNPKEFKRRLDIFISKTHDNKRISGSYGISDNNTKD